jgi:hypothetical protein
MMYYSCLRSCNVYRLEDNGLMRSCNVYRLGDNGLMRSRNVHRLGNDSRFREMVAVVNSWTFSNRKMRLFLTSILDILGVLDVIVNKRVRVNSTMVKLIIFWLHDDMMLA